MWSAVFLYLFTGCILTGYVSNADGADGADGADSVSVSLLLRRIEQMEMRHIDSERKHSQEITELKTSIAELSVKINEPQNPGVTKRDLQYDGNNIAFTAYLDHDLEGIGMEQVMVFNQILLNDGNAYNKYTGVFTAPVAGVYHFNFFIGERDVNQMYVWLVVNGTNKVDAVAESIQSTHDAQGGNVANLKLGQGDAVFVKHLKPYSGNHLEGSDSVRISTFSGFLLYSVEDLSVNIVGK